jgi:hypothetical protein
VQVGDIGGPRGRLVLAHTRDDGHKAGRVGGIQKSKGASCKAAQQCEQSVQCETPAGRQSDKTKVYVWALPSALCEFRSVKEAWEVAACILCSGLAQQSWQVSS